jgi:hypothetical protein
MLKRVSTVALGLAVLPAVLSAAEPQKFGAGVSLKDTMPVEQVIAAPASFEGKTVRVDGTVTAVCTMMGCWMALAPADSPTSTMMIKVDDGVIVFPVSAKGKRASAEGVVQRIGNDHESHEAAAEHAAGTKAEKPAQWQLKATGALIY